MRKIIIAILLILCLRSSVLADTATFYSNNTNLGGYVEAYNTNDPPTYSNSYDGSWVSRVCYHTNSSNNLRNIAVIYFDTSSLPDGATITSASLKLYLNYYQCYSNNTIYFDYFGYTSRGSGWYTTDSLSGTAGTSTVSNFGPPNYYGSLSLSNVNGSGNINKVGYTGFRIAMNSKQGDSPNYDELIFRGSGYQSGEYPTLSVTYTTGYSKKINGVISAARVNNIPVPSKVNGL